MAAGIYIHIPFCKRKCPYCDFYSVIANSTTRHSYISALVDRITKYGNRSISVDTIYFGGGTPSLIAPEDISKVICTLKNSYTVSDDCEITMECNPSSTALDKLIDYRSAGVNRLSFGVQSSNEAELIKLGRLHSFPKALQAVNDAHKAGFINISCDLMIGTPDQTVSSLISSVCDITAMGVTHISCYMLKIEEGTAYDCDSVRALVADDDTVSDMYLALVSKLNDLGFPQYEISNFSKEGYHSKHNTKYWTGEPYIGFGPASHSYFDGKRTYSAQTVDEFILNPLAPDVIEDESPDPLEEYILLGLRLSRGISLERITKLGGNAKAVADSLAPFISAGFASLDGDNLKLTAEGFLRSNGIISTLIDAAIGENT